MKKSTVFSMLSALAFTYTLVSCMKQDEIGPNDKNTVILDFDNRVGTQNLELGSKMYKNAAGEDFSVTTLNYFVSNIKLKKSDGMEVKFPDQYFLIREIDPKTLAVKLNDVPAGDYTSLSFIIGVDSLKSTADVSQRKGVLDIASYGDDAMYWSWNSGYIFLKFEGISPAAPPRANGVRSFQMHIGGYGGFSTRTPNNLRTVHLPIKDMAKVRKNKSPEIHIFADVLKILDGTTRVSFATTNNVHNPAVATPIANNYVNMFSIDHVHN
ncbi:MAG: MbnP family protein [Runella sp.]